MLHTTYKLYLVSVAAQLLHLVIMCATYAQYGQDGVENYSAKTFGFDILSMNSRSVVHCLLIPSAVSSYEIRYAQILNLDVNRR